MEWIITKSPSSEVVVAEVPLAVYADGAGADVQKTNHGHGNNLDSVDVSNPGKSADKWVDTQNEDGTIEDDEAKGGSKSVSKTQARK